MNEEQSNSIPLSICVRCGKEYDEPIPKVTDPTGIKEIASEHFCADCNALIMTVIYRNRSAYRKGDLGGSQVIGRNYAD